MHNFDSLDILLKILNFEFDVVALTETWNSEDNKHKFIPGNLEIHITD